MLPDPRATIKRVYIVRSRFAPTHTPPLLPTRSTHRSMICSIPCAAERGDAARCARRTMTTLADALAPLATLVLSLREAAATDADEKLQLEAIAAVHNSLATSPALEAALPHVLAALEPLSRTISDEPKGSALTPAVATAAARALADTRTHLPAARLFWLLDECGVVDGALSPPRLPEAAAAARARLPASRATSCCHPRAQQESGNAAARGAARARGPRIRLRRRRRHRRRRRRDRRAPPPPLGAAAGDGAADRARFVGGRRRRSPPPAPRVAAARGGHPRVRARARRRAHRAPRRRPPLSARRRRSCRRGRRRAAIGRWRPTGSSANPPPRRRLRRSGSASPLR